MKCFCATAILISSVMLGSCSIKKNIVDLDKNKEESVVLKVGETITVKLRENPSTGHFWNPVVPENCSATLGTSEYKQDKSEPNMVGVPGTRTYEIIGKSSGDCTIKFEHKSPGASETVSTNILHIKVK